MASAAINPWDFLVNLRVRGILFPSACGRCAGALAASIRYEGVTDVVDAASLLVDSATPVVPPANQVSYGLRSDEVGGHAGKARGLGIDIANHNVQLSERLPLRMAGKGSMLFIEDKGGRVERQESRVADTVLQASSLAKRAAVTCDANARHRF